jgi:tetratricopeptide (TPR) repeat protein
MQKIKYFILILIMIIFSISLTSCRPPELEGAIVHYNSGRNDQAYDLALSASEKYPDNAEVWYYLGEIQGKKNLVKEMMESFAKSLAISNSQASKIEAAKTTYFGKYFNDGAAAYNTYLKFEDKESEAALNKLESMRDNFMKVLMIRDNYMAHRMIAISYQTLKDDENALKYFRSAAESDPDTVLAWLDLGFYYARLKDYNQAAENFGKGLEVSPNHTECLTLYAQNLDFADRQDEAVEAYKTAIEKNKKEKAIPFNLGLLLNKQANQAKDDVEKNKALMSEAIKYFLMAVDLDPQLKDAYDLAAALLLQMERYQEAEKLLDKGVINFPESASMWQNYSYLHAKLGNKEKAEDAYKRSQELQGD